MPRVNGNGNVVYQHNFYILKPVDLRKGNHKMMYEPPNRGGKTYGTINNTRPTSGQRSGNVLTDPAILADSFLWPAATRQCGADGKTTSVR